MGFEPPAPPPARLALTPTRARSPPPVRAVRAPRRRAPARRAPRRRGERAGQPRKATGGIVNAAAPLSGLRPGPAADPGFEPSPLFADSRARLASAWSVLASDVEPTPSVQIRRRVRGEPRRMASRRERKRRGPGDASGPRGTGEVRRRRRRRRRPERIDAEAVYLRRLRGRASGLPREAPPRQRRGSGYPAALLAAFCSAMASESIPRDPCRWPPPGEEPSPVATGDAGTPARAGGDAPKPYVAFPAQEFCRNGRPAARRRGRSKAKVAPRRGRGAGARGGGRRRERGGRRARMTRWGEGGVG